MAHLPHQPQRYRIPLFFHKKIFSYIPRALLILEKHGIRTCSWIAQDMPRCGINQNQPTVFPLFNKCQHFFNNKL